MCLRKNISLSSKNDFCFYFSEIKELHIKETRGRVLWQYSTNALGLGIKKPQS